MIAVFLACFKDWRPLLGPGELGTIMVVAEDRKQARAIMRFIRGLLHGAPMLKRTIVSETAESFTLEEPHPDRSACRELPIDTGLHHRRRLAR